MKRLNSLKKVICASLVLVLLFAMSTYASASTIGNNTTSEKQAVYTQAQINAEWAKAKFKPIMPDKTVDKSKGKGHSITASYGTYPTRPGVILVTPDFYKGLIPTGHSAIIWTSTKVVESVASGVVLGPNNWNTSKNNAYGVTTYGTTAAQDNTASNWCYGQRGKPYNYNYLNPYTRSKFYCSQLIYAAYLDLYGINLDTSAFFQAVHPMELVNSPNTYTIYRK